MMRIHLYKNKALNTSRLIAPPLSSSTTSIAPQKSGEEKLLNTTKSILLKMASQNQESRDLQPGHPMMKQDQGDLSSSSGLEENGHDEAENHGVGDIRASSSDTGISHHRHFASKYS